MITYTCDKCKNTILGNPGQSVSILKFKHNGRPYEKHFCTKCGEEFLSILRNSLSLSKTDKTEPTVKRRNDPSMYADITKQVAEAKIEDTGNDFYESKLGPVHAPGYVEPPIPDPPESQIINSFRPRVRNKGDNDPVFGTIPDEPDLPYEQRAGRFSYTALDVYRRWEPYKHRGLLSRTEAGNFMKICYALRVPIDVVAQVIMYGEGAVRKNYKNTRLAFGSQEYAYKAFRATLSKYEDLNQATEAMNIPIELYKSAVMPLMNIYENFLISAKTE